MQFVKKNGQAKAVRPSRALVDKNIENEQP